MRSAVNREIHRFESYHRRPPNEESLGYVLLNKYLFNRPNRYLFIYIKTGSVRLVYIAALLMRSSKEYESSNLSLVVNNMVALPSQVVRRWS